MHASFGITSIYCKYIHHPSGELRYILLRTNLTQYYYLPHQPKALKSRVHHSSILLKYVRILFGRRWKRTYQDMAKMRTLSEETMHRIKQNDPTLKQLRIGSMNNDINEEDNNMTMKCIREFAKLGTTHLGSYISENTHLTYIIAA